MGGILLPLFHLKGKGEGLAPAGAGPTPAIEPHHEQKAVADATATMTLDEQSSTSDALNSCRLRYPRRERLLRSTTQRRAQN